MAKSPEIVTQRLRIVPVEERHLTPLYVSWLTDKEVVRYSDHRFRKHTLDSCRSYWESFVGTPNYFWAIEILDGEPAHIGNMAADVDEVHQVADLSILIGERTAWEQGYGSEAWIAGCDYLLSELGMRKITAGAREVNKGMLGVMRRAGMVEDGRRVRQCLFEGREVDKVYVALFREEWERRKVENARMAELNGRNAIVK